MTQISEARPVGADRMRVVPYIARVIALGAGFWALGVLSVRVLAASGGFIPSFTMPLLLGTLPAAWLAIRLARRLLPLETPQLVEGIALLSAPALLLDGAVFTWAPRLYAANVADQRAAAAWLLWFVGVTIVLACIAARRSSSTAKDAYAIR